MSEKAPRTDAIETVVPAVTIAADDSTNIGRAPYAATVTAVTYTPEAAITGAPTDNRTFSLINKGQAGAGTTVVATRIATVTLAADDENTITLSVVAGATTLVAGDVLEWASVHNASGVADPGGLVSVSLSRA